jgi:hypothetical protein
VLKAAIHKQKSVLYVWTGIYLGKPAFRIAATILSKSSFFRIGDLFSYVLTENFRLSSDSFSAAARAFLSRPVKTYAGVAD